MLILSDSQRSDFTIQKYLLVVSVTTTRAAAALSYIR